MCYKLRPWTLHFIILIVDGMMYPQLLNLSKNQKDQVTFFGYLKPSLDPLAPLKPPTLKYF